MALTRRELLAASAFAPLARDPKEKRPNIVLFVSDDQGYGDLSLHGNPALQTPNLDRIAQEGAEFTDFLVNPVCSPTRSSLLTGRYYYRTGVVDTYLGRSMMYNDEVTIAEVLRGVGYKTGIFGKWHLGDHYPLRPMEQGFEEVLVHEGGGIGQPSDPPDGNSYFNPKLMHNGRQEQRNGYCTMSSSTARSSSSPKKNTSLSLLTWRPTRRMCLCRLPSPMLRPFATRVWMKPPPKRMACWRIWMKMPAACSLT